MNRHSPDAVLLAITSQLPTHAGLGLKNNLALPEEGPVYLAFRNKGVLLFSMWTPGRGWAADISEAVVQKLGDQGLNASVDSIEVCLTHSFRDVTLPQLHRELTNVHRGIKGLELHWLDRYVLHSPTAMLARNVSFAQLIDEFCCFERIPDDQRRAPQFQLRTFRGHQYIVRMDREVDVVAMQRGSRFVPFTDVTHDNVVRLRDDLASWMIRNIHDDGRMTYKYYPSRGSEAESNNVIRQLMGTVCLNRLARTSGDQKVSAMAERNLAYNLDQFYVSEGDLGFIQFQGEIKLGAAAMATLAVVESPARLRFVEMEARLLRFLEYMWEPTGAFRSFFRPIERAYDNQNFYPGEALVTWAAVMERQPSDSLLNRFMASVGYYREWHQARRNPAFVPWHTMAYAAMWRQTGKRELLEYIFEMNDWLSTLQQWQEAPCDDLRGRFYDKQHPEYGPPHASSDGVYLEGLVDAFELARRIGDTARAQRYRRVLLRGLRHLMQLQYRTDVDMYYISKRDRVLGGLKTTLYDNAIRIDNVQHTLMAVLKIVTVLGRDDYTE